MPHRTCQVYIARLQLLAAMVTEVPCIAGRRGDAWRRSGGHPAREQGGLALGAHRSVGHGLVQQRQRRGAGERRGPKLGRRFHGTWAKAVKLVAACYAHAGLRRIVPWHSTVLTCLDCCVARLCRGEIPGKHTAGCEHHQSDSSARMATRSF